MNIYALLTLICNYIFDAGEKRAIMIAGEVVECVRIDRDYVVIYYPER
jgi:hypothetical protein